MNKVKIVVISIIVLLTLICIENRCLTKLLVKMTGYKSYKYEMNVIANIYSQRIDTTCVTTLSAYAQDLMLKNFKKVGSNVPCSYYENDDTKLILVDKYLNSLIEYIKVDKSGLAKYVTFNSKYHDYIYQYHIGRYRTSEISLDINNFYKDSLYLNLKLYRDAIFYGSTDFTESSPIDTLDIYVDQCLLCVKDNSILDTLIVYENRFNDYSFDKWRGKSPLSEFKE